MVNAVVRLTLAWCGKGPSMMIVGLFCCVIAHIVWLPHAASAEERAEASGAEVLQTVFDDWRQRRGRIQSVQYVAEGTGLVPKGAFDVSHLPGKSEERIPTEDYVYEYARHFLVDFANNRFRIEKIEAIFSEPEGTFTPVHDIWAFDGSKLSRRMIGVTRGRGTHHYSAVQPEFRYHKLDYPGVLAVSNWPVFVGHGIILGSGNLARIEDIGTSISSDRILQHGQGVFRGRECLVLRTLPRADDPAAAFFELWVDVPRESAVVRVILYSGGSIDDYVDIDYQETPQGWYPVGWQHTMPGIELEEGIPIRISTVTVQQLELNPRVEDSDFELQPTAGMMVRDDPERTAYLLGPRGERLPRRHTPPTAGGFLAQVAVVLMLSAISLFVIVRLLSRREVRQALTAGRTRRR